MATFGKTLRRIRRLKDLSQREAAERIPMDESYFSRLETDRLGSMPTRETIDKIAKALECDEADYSELLTAAGRLDQELASISELAKERPAVGKFFRAAVRLSPEKLEELIAKFETESTEAAPGKGLAERKDDEKI